MLGAIQILGVLGLGFGRQKKLIGNVDDIAPYTMFHNSINILCRGLLGLSVVNGVRFFSQKAKGNACRYLETMEESINSAFYVWVVIKRVIVEVAKLKDVPL